MNVWLIHDEYKTYFVGLSKKYDDPDIHGRKEQPGGLPFNKSHNTRTRINHKVYS